MTPASHSSSPQVNSVQTSTGRALITGADGFVGPHLADHLREAGDDPVGTDLATGPNLLDAQGWIDLVGTIKPKVIYHLAGWSDVGSSWKSPNMTQRVNAEGTLNVLEAARLGDVSRVLIISSADLYGAVDPVNLPLTRRCSGSTKLPVWSKQAVSRSYC